MYKEYKEDEVYRQDYKKPSEMGEDKGYVLNKLAIASDQGKPFSSHLCRTRGDNAY